MEDILASIKKVIAEEKELRATALTDQPVASGEAESEGDDGSDDVLELDHPIGQPEPAIDDGPPLLDDQAAESTRYSLQELSSVAAAAPAQPPANPLEDMVREMLRPILKEWLDEHLPQIVNDHVKREISRITGRKL